MQLTQRYMSFIYLFVLVQQDRQFLALMQPAGSLLNSEQDECSLRLHHIDISNNSFNNILSTRRYPMLHLPFIFTDKMFECVIILTRTVCLSHPWSSFDHSRPITFRVKAHIWGSLCNFLHTSNTSSVLTHILPTPYYETQSFWTISSEWRIRFYIDA
jgi:hypothetical protein